MTPAARLSAAITVLDRVLAGDDVEAALTNWGRASRFAGSGDRHAVRDLVYDALRRKRSAALMGGGESGRGLILGLLRLRGEDPAASFTGTGHDPAPIGPKDMGSTPTGLAALDCPDWLGPSLQDSLGEGFSLVMAALQQRAPIYLRVNWRKGTTAQALAMLAQDGITATPSNDVKTALQVTGNARKIHMSRAYASGLVELQDLSSQAVVQALPLAQGATVLDYCAGGGGKTLAMAGQAQARFHAYDIHPARMKDLPVRAERAGVAVKILREPGQCAPYDLVLCDAPCSGSGSWRRDPQGKWTLTPEKLNQIMKIQAQILDNACRLVKPGGHLAYMTCSILQDENAAQIGAFLQRHPEWTCNQSLGFSALTEGDGFYAAILSIGNKG